MLLPLLVQSIGRALSVLFWLVFIEAILSWVPGLISGSGWIASFERAARAVTEPLLSPIRDRMPGAGAIDFSPLVLMLLIQVAHWLLIRLLVG